MDFTPRLAALRQDMAAVQDLLRGGSVVACLGSRLLLTLLACQVDDPGLLVGTVTTAAEGLASVREHRPRFLIVGDELEQGSGVDLVVQTKALWPGTHTLLLVSQEQRLHRLRAAVEAGCDGICRESRIGGGTVLAALRTVAAGALYLDSSLADQLRRCAEGTATPRDALSTREVEVLQELLNGYTNQQIGARLFISADTVKTHLANIIDKLQARDRTHAAVIGLWLGLVDWPEAQHRR
jgi:DNA-binding NarL/FixJ family response regulator